MLTRLAVLMLSSALLLAACTGPQGPAGPDGTNGTNGTNGTTGDKGDTGTPGTPGATGPKGDTGTPGTLGTPGTPGTPGAPGTPGTPGGKGDPGPVGPVGPGFTGAVYSDWKAVTSANFTGTIEKAPIYACLYEGGLESNSKLTEAAYRNGIILVYQKRPERPTYYAERIRPVPFSDDHVKASFTLTTYLSVYLEVSYSFLKDSSECEGPLSTEDLRSNILYRYVLIPVPSAKSKLAPSSLSTSLERAKAWYGLNDLSYESVKQRFGLKD